MAKVVENIVKEERDEKQNEYGRGRMADEGEQPSSSVTYSSTYQNGCSAKECCSNEGCTSIDECEVEANASEGWDCEFDRMPDVVMQCVFEIFDLRERIALLIMNFSLKCYHITNSEMLLTILQHCHSVSSVKIWFSSSSFAGGVLKMLKQMNIKMRCLDLYPYRAEEALDEAFAAFPELTGMTMRPHGQDYFWSGLDLTSFPSFEKMDTLMLDGFNIHPDVFLPESLTTLEWLNRSGHFLVVMPKLKSLVNLEYLMLGHAEFSNSEEFDAFLTTISSENLPRLQYLVTSGRVVTLTQIHFSYCRCASAVSDPHLSTNDIDESTRALSALNFSSLDISLSALQMIKLDLCYANLTYIVRKMLPFTRYVFSHSVLLIRYLAQ
uniref:F-box domain-containing protein n=1 Tax=Ascaris lumbricoides TaxID=6252 RepID=A0A9J2PVF9_ASCLU